MSVGSGAGALLEIYDDAVPVVYGYLLRRCRDTAVAEDLTSETFLAAMDAARRGAMPSAGTAWLVGVARHKLADHWRRSARTATPVADVPETVHDGWDAELDRLVAEHVLARLTPLHRAVLTLRYVDDLTVADCAEHLGRTVSATEALLTRAKRDFRAHYPGAPTARRRVVTTHFEGRDPFAVLRADDTPLDPSTDFRRRLRSRLEQGAALPEGIDMSITLDETPSATAGSPVVERPGALPYLTVGDGRAAIEWYTRVLGGRLRGEPITMDDGSVGHAEIEIGGGVVYLAETSPDLGLAAPAPGAVSVSLMLAVPDTDRAVAAARAGGATVQREPYEGHGSRTGAIIDPFGHRWMLTGPTRSQAVSRARRGDLIYPSLCVPDVEAAVRFYGSVLGWRYDPETRQVTNLGHRLGISSLGDLRTVFCVYAVDDLDTTRAAIVAAGGRDVTEPGGHPGSLDAVDDQGTRFAVYVPDVDEPRGALHPSGHGELTYLTVETPDSGVLRDFYGSVLGWEFTAGRIDDGWEVDDARPQIGIAGGARTHAAVAMWAVDDIDRAVSRVRQAGGEVISEPERMPYATVAECRDDQGVRFYLGQY